MHIRKSIKSGISYRRVNSLNSGLYRKVRFTIMQFLRHQVWRFFIYTTLMRLKNMKELIKFEFQKIIGHKSIYIIGLLMFSLFLFVFVPPSENREANYAP